jgi:radical SAM superfamily enzyme YgiQ (UPF0313 family)
VRVKLILPALTEATSPRGRSIKYSLFPPLGLATLAAHLDPTDEVELADEHVAPLTLDDAPDLVVIQCYVTSARRSYELADEYRRRGAHVAIGGLHPTALPDEAAAHADTVFVGPGDHSFPDFLRDLRAGHPRARYTGIRRTLVGLPPPRRDLIARHRYLVPNSLVVTRGCPHHCDFCYKDAFYRGGRSFYTRAIDEALREIDSLPGRHLYFLDDQLFADERFARELFGALRGAGRVIQAAGTVRSALRPGLLELAAEAGLRSLFIGFESLRADNLREHGKVHGDRPDFERAIAHLHGLGVMINASFVFGMDHDDESVFNATVDWAVAQGLETATFHVLTPYPGTELFSRLQREGRLLHRRWDDFDTRHAVFTPQRMSPATLERGYRRAYDRFYRWSSLWRAACTKPEWKAVVQHLAYAGAWKKLEPVWAAVIRSGALPWALPVLEATLDRFRRARGGSRAEPDHRHLRLAQGAPRLGDGPFETPARPSELGRAPLVPVRVRDSIDAAGRGGLTPWSAA